MVAVLFVIAGLSAPSIARANFFDDSNGKWWMDKDNWEVFTPMDPGGRIEMMESGNNLVMNYAPGWAAGWTDGYEGDNGYVSKWGLSLNNDFETTVDYHVGYKGNKWAGLDFAVGYYVEGESLPRLAGTSVGWDGTPHNQFYYLDFLTKNGFQGADIYNSTNSPDYVDGYMRAKYDAGTDTFRLDAFLYNDGAISPLGNLTFNNLKTTLNNAGADSLHVALLGATSGADFSDGQVYFTKFNLNQGTVTPEPLSCLLFLLGAGAFVGGRRLGKKRDSV
jgi:hypothetical protein